MSDVSLLIVGEGPAFAMAVAIATRTHREGSFRAFELRTEEINSTGLEFLADADPAATKVFAAVGFSALNFARYDLWAKFRFRGFRSEVLVHPTADVDASAEVGENCLIGPFVSIGGRAQLGRANILMGRNDVGVGGRIGSFNWMGRGAGVGASASLGSHIVIGEGVVVCDGTSIGDHSEITIAGAYRESLARGTFISTMFDKPAKMIGDTWSNAIGTVPAPVKTAS
jgi:UDP-3-O-[3-hydroxymyristoyl] glucosamine N-acyltransferase